MSDLHRTTKANTLLDGTRDNRFPEWEYKPIFDAGLEETRIRLQQVQNTTMQIPAPITPATVTPATLASATIMPAADTPGARTPVSVSLVGGGSGGTNQPVLSFREVTGSHIEVILVNNIQTINTTGTSRGRHRGRGSSRGNLQGDRRGTGGGEQNSLHAARVNVMTGPAERGTDLAINDVNEWPNLPAAALPSRR